MKNALKKVISVLLVTVMVLCSAPLTGFVGLELPEIGGLGKLADSVSEFFAGFGNKAEASSEVFDYELDENGNATITGFDYSLAGDLVIPSTIDGYLVTALGDWSFSWSDISSVVIPEGVISIGGAAFQGCYNLVDVSIPNSVRYIYSNAFQECINLSKIDIPEGVKEIWTEAFSYCERLASVTLPDSLEMVAENAFMETAIYLNEDNWENGVLYIDNYLIEANKSIEGSYSIKEGTTGIAYNSFYGSDKLTNIIFPEGLKYIGDSAFYQCSSLESVTLSDELKKIYDSAFFQCSSLKSIIFPVGLNYIGHKAFYSAPLTDAYYIGSEFQWAKIEIGEMNPSLSNVVFLSDGIGLVPVEGSTTVIERGGNSFDDWFVYGLKTRLRDTALSDYITVKGDGYYEAIPVYVSYFGTGSVINVYNSETNELLESFNVVIFGDINGDSTINMVDASMILDEMIGVTDWSDPESEEYSPSKLKAGDLNADGIIDFYDYFVVNAYALGIFDIDQATGQKDRYDENYYIFYYDLNYVYETIELISTEMHSAGDTIKPLEYTSTTEGYNFIEWIDFETGEALSSTMPSYDVVALPLLEPASGYYELDFFATGGEFEDGRINKFFVLEEWEEIPAIPNPTREGYVFLGWLDEDGKRVIIPVTMPAQNLSFYAEWEPIENSDFTLTLLDNDGTIIDEISALPGEELSLPQLSKEGYIFGGWLKEDSGETYYDTIVMPDEDVVLVSIWEVSQYTLVLDANGGEFSDETYVFTETYSFGEEIVYPALPAREGYVFCGWMDEEGNFAAIPSTMPAEDMTFVAVWEPVEYHVRFVDDDGNVIFQVSVEYGSEIPVSETTPTKEGYTFAGWVDAEGKSPYEYDKMPARDVTFVAQWIPHEYTVVLDANGGEFSDGTQIFIETAGYGEDISDIIPDYPTREGYNFIGWMDEDYNLVEYLPATMPARDIELKAQWVANSDVEYILEVYMMYSDGTYPVVPTETIPFADGIVGETRTVDYTPPEGFSIDENYSVLSGVIPADGQLILKVYLSRNVYTLNLDVDGVRTESSYIYGQEIGYIEVPAREGYLFDGWMDEDGKIVELPATMPAEDITFYALWSLKICTVTFDANGGLFDAGSHDEFEILIIQGYYGELCPYPTDEPTREGYTFVGWSPVIERFPALDVTLYAVWEANKYNLVLDANGGKFFDGTTRTEGTFTYGLGVTYSNPTRDGYEFIGWMDEDGNIGDFPSSLPAKDITLVAQWEPIETNEYTITYMDGDNVLRIDTYMEGESVIIQFPEEIEGYTFVGWSPSVPSIMPAEDIVTYAIWETNKHSVTYDANGGIFDYHDGTTSIFIVFSNVKYGAAIPVPESTPVREGYKFVRWAPEAPAAMPNRDLIFVAEWEKIPELEEEEYEIYVSYPNPVSPDEKFEMLVMTDSALPGDTVEILREGDEQTADKAHTYEEILSTVTVNGIEPDYEKRPATITIGENNKIVVEFKLTTYAVEFNANGGKFNNSEETIVLSGTYGQMVEDVSAPTRSGYNFYGWDRNVPETFTEDIVIYATWEIQNHNAIFIVVDENGEEIERITVEYEYGEEIVAPNYTAPAGYEFSGWDIPEGMTMGEEDVTFISTLTPIGYTLSYEISGLPADKGVSAPVTQMGLRVDFDAPIAAAPVVPGYTFDGWYYNGAKYSCDGNGVIKMPASDVVLTCRYIANVYTITFDSDSSTVISPVSFTCDEIVESLPEVTKENCVFLGWFEGETKYEAGFKMPARDVTLTARWSSQSCYIEFYVGDYFIAGGSQNYGDIILTPETVPDKAGYTFIGWFDEDGNPMPETVPAIEHQIYYARFSEKTYTATFDAEGGVFSNGSDCVVYEGVYGSTIICPEEPTRFGYIFIGWSPVVPETMPAQNIVFTAMWTPCTYSVNYYLNGELIHTDSVEFGDIIPVFSYEPDAGIEFDDWGGQNPAGQTMPAYDINVYGTTSVNAYNVTFTINGEVVAVVPVEYNAVIPVPEYVAPEGHTFSGWDVPATMPASDITIDATLVVNTYTAYFYLTDEDMAEGNYWQKVDTVFGEEIKFPEDPEIDGFWFEGWDNDATVMGAADMHFVAVTTAIEYLVEVYDENGEYVNGWKAYFGDKILEDDLPEINKDGYILEWYTDAECTIKHEFPVVVNGDVMFYSKFVRQHVYVESNVKRYEELDKQYDKFVYVGIDVIEVANGQLTDGYVQPGDWLEYRATILSDMYVGACTPHIVYERDFFDVRVITSTTPSTSETFENNDYERLVKFDDGTFMNPAHPVAPQNNEIASFNTLVSLPYERVTTQLGFCGIDAATYENWDFVKSNLGVTATMTNTNFEMKTDEWITSWYVRVKEDLIDGETGRSFSPEAIWKHNINTITGNPGDSRRFGDIYTADSLGTYASAKSLSFRTDVVQHVLLDDTYHTFTIGKSSSDVISEYKVTWNVDGNIINEYYYAGEEIVVPEPPEKRGHTFVGWDSYIPSTMPAKNLMFTAVYEVNSYNVDWCIDGLIMSDTYEYGETIEAPGPFRKKGYTFVGWTPAVPETMPDYDLTFEAVWQINTYTVTWDWGFDGNVVEVEYDYNQSIVSPEIPDREGYTFVGWTPAVPDSMPDKNLSFVAQWEINRYNITWIVDGNETVYEYTFNEEITVPATPEKVGYTFVQWSPEVPDRMPAHDLIFEAEFIVNKYIVRWDIDGVISEVEYEYNSVIEIPEIPERIGHTFIGWNEEIPEFMPDHDLTFIAKWKVNRYIVIWNFDGEQVVQEYYYGDEIIPLPLSEKTGYTFEGWTPEVPETMPDRDLEFTAIWTINSYDAVFDANGGKFSDGKIIKYIPIEYNSEILSPETPTRDGYDFAGWEYEGNNIGMDFGVMDRLDGKKFTAIWVSNNTSKYKIETYTMNTFGGYDKSSIILLGKAEDNVLITPEVEPGFELNEEKSVLVGTVLADEIIVLKVYVDRISYNFTVNIDGVCNTVSYYYGAMISEPETPIKEGYEFIGWDTEIPQTMPAEDISITAKFKEAENYEPYAKLSISDIEDRTLYYGETITLYANVSNLPEGAVIKWYVEGNGVSIKTSASGKTCTVTSTSNGNVIIRATVLDENGNTVEGFDGKPVSDYEYIYSKVTFWQVIVNFFRSLFSRR